MHFQRSYKYRDDALSDVQALHDHVKLFAQAFNSAWIPCYFEVAKSKINYTICKHITCVAGSVSKDVNVVVIPKRSTKDHRNAAAFAQSKLHQFGYRNTAIMRTNSKVGTKPANGGVKQTSKPKRKAKKWVTIINPKNHLASAKSATSCQSPSKNTRWTFAIFAAKQRGQQCFRFGTYVN